MRFKALFVIAVLLVSAVVIAEDVKTSDQMSLRVWKVGEELKCLCGAQCAYTVASCNMLHCSFREEVNPQIQDGLEAGLDPTRIIEMLRAKYGAVLHAQPSAVGFGMVAWAMPFAALAVGLAAVPFVMRRLRKVEPESDDIEPVDEEAVKRYSESIDQEELDDLV